jgi:alpha-tubulin suppressor-like RCC1 family protein
LVSLGARLFQVTAFALSLLACGARSSLDDGAGNDATDGGGPGAADQLPQCPMQSGYVPIAAGSDHSCTVRIGRVYCWGSNELGQVGNGDSEDALTATPIDVPCGVTWLAAGLNHTCAIVPTAPDGGDVYCWGANESLQAGGPSDTAILYGPRRVELPAGVATQLVAGARHTCASTYEGLYCWGNNVRGQLGPWGPANFGPTKVPDDYVTIANELVAGGDVTCAADSYDGIPRCWGDDSFGQHGDGTADGSLGPTIVSGSVTPLTLGSRFAIAGGASTLIGWGDSSSGVLGPELSGIVAEPQVLPFLDLGPDSWAPIAGAEHACILTGATGPSAGVHCWGANDSGQLGNGSKNGSSIPIPVGLPQDVIAEALTISAGGAHTCVHESLYTNLKIDWLPKVYCWGANDHGQLGDGTREERLSPARVVGIPVDPILDN